MVSTQPLDDDPLWDPAIIPIAIGSCQHFYILEGDPVSISISLKAILSAFLYPSIESRTNVQYISIDVMLSAAPCSLMRYINIHTSVIGIPVASPTSILELSRNIYISISNHSN